MAKTVNGANLLTLNSLYNYLSSKKLTKNNNTLELTGDDNLD